jgi:hypothetical protein
MHFRTLRSFAHVSWISLLLAGPCIGDIKAPHSSIVVYGDSSANWIAEIEKFAELIGQPNRPQVVSGGSIAKIPENSSLVWFGDLVHDNTESENAPESLRSVVNSLGMRVHLSNSDLSSDNIVMGVNCFNHHIDGDDGLPELAVSFSGDDPQSVCKGYTIAYILLAHSKWNRDNGSD